jgi:hypothetical protein
MTKKNLIAGVCLSLFVSTLFISGCLKNKDTQVLTEKGTLEVLTNTADSYAAQFAIGGKTFNYASTISGTTTTSTLKVVKGDALIYATTYDLNTAIPDYRLVQHTKVEDIARALSFPLQEADYVLIGAETKAFLEAVFYSTGVTKKHVQSIFFHYAVITTRQRSLADANGTIECVPHPGYVLDKSYFWSQQDYMVKVALIKDVFAQHPDLMQQPKAVKLLAYINTVKEETISYDKIYAFSVSKQDYLQTLNNILVRNNPPPPTGTIGTDVVAGCAWWCPLGCGSDWGCCGNYSGCCLYASVECYIHDAICTNCEPRWFCFSGCVPD